MKSDPSLGAEFWRPKLKELVFTKTINGVKDNDEELAIIDLDGKTRFWLFDATGDENKWFIKKSSFWPPPCFHCTKGYAHVFCSFKSIMINSCRVIVYIALYSRVFFIAVGKYSKAITQMKITSCLQSKRGACFLRSTLRK